MKALLNFLTWVFGAVVAVAIGKAHGWWTLAAIVGAIQMIDWGPPLMEWARAKIHRWGMR